ncbi:MAG: ABC transporter ATP-binding protein [Corynebacterium sp.]|uniref:energy-coupling factor ABC transporter ATP-binding protein n=1 Tax=Corynebacterium sp. TaxID=1720 RepID=UPI0026DB8282|nr:ABC transporter ATP-binding protein [Corynebacterium sp.]MDO5030993.1 ABC transporter ATP-binding protein [Corynebacterium sp.]
MSNPADRGGSILQAAGIGYSYDYHRVLSDVSLTISPGERLALLGANGSGKSTLLRTLAGSLKPDVGEVRLDGAPYNYSRKGRNEVRRSVQMVTQDPDEQIFAASVFADVSFGPVNMGLSREQVEQRVRESLATAEISDLAERVPHQLSYGQRKRVALAGALAMRPRVLLLDEPSAGLDPQATRKLAHTLNLLREQGTAVVVATHDIDFAWNFADMAAVLADGQLRVGKKEEILADRALIKHARLALPWAPLVSAIVGREVRYPEDCVDLA